MKNIVNIKQLAPLAKVSAEYSSLSDDYVFTHICSDGTTENASDDFKAWSEGHAAGPMRIDGISWLLCFDGEMELDINLTPSTLGSNCLTVTSPGSIIEAKGIPTGKIDFYALFVSTRFMNDINFDLNILGTIPAMGGMQNRDHILHMTPDEAAHLRRYFELIHGISRDGCNPVYSKAIARCLIAALVYQMIDLWTQRVKDTPKGSTQKTRRTTYLHSFLQLVNMHYRRERSVAFYADKLFISPKYLSLIIKDQTGRSAAQLIDSYVILEAKNLLRFSGKNIQQIAYELNFPNQSSFGKYFKHLTGMSPSDYQKS